MENEIMYIKLDDIIPNRFQPREVFEEEALNKLADSIRQHGVIEPIIVRPIANKYEIVAGERRYKASILAGLTKIPAIIKPMDDKESSIVAFIENEHRSDVSAIEEARTIDRILKNNDMTQEELAKELGMNQSTLANKLRLLNLPMEVQESLMRNEISERHARSLLSIKDESKQKELLEKIKERKMTVRELESEIKNMNEGMNNFNNTGFMNEPNYSGNNGFSPLPNFDLGINNNNQSGGFNPMSYENNFGSNPLPPVNDNPPVPPTTPESSGNTGFSSFLNDFDKKFPLPSEENPEGTDGGASNYLNNNPEPAPSTPANPGLDFLNSFNTTSINNDPLPPVSNESVNPAPVVPTPSQSFIDNDIYSGFNKPIDNVTLNNVNPPITSNFNSQNNENNINYVDVPDEPKINSVDEIIDKLSVVVNEIKEKSIYKVDTEEINYDDIYQITIKIDKRDFN